MLGNFSKNSLSQTLSECQTVDRDQADRIPGLIWVQTACKDQQQMTEFPADRHRVNEYILFSRIVFGSEMAGTTEQYSRILFMSYMYVSFSFGIFHKQGSHSHEKYLNLEGFLEKYLKIKSALKSTGKSLKALNFVYFSVGLNTFDRELNQYKIVVPLFGAANAAPNKGTTI